MKTTITFDTARLVDPEQRKRLEEAPGFVLAPLLRELAKECERTSNLPEPRALLLDEIEEGSDPPIIGSVATIRGEPAGAGSAMTFEQAAVLVDSASDLLALGNRLDTLAHSLADAGEPQDLCQPLVDATGRVGAAMRAIFDALEAAHADGGGPFHES